MQPSFLNECGPSTDKNASTVRSTKYCDDMFSISLFVMKSVQFPLHCKSIKFPPKCKFLVIFHSIHLLHISRPSPRVNDQTELASLFILSSKTKSLPLGQQIHAQIVKLGISTHVSSLNTLISVYSKCGALAHAVRLFDDMPAKNLVSWTSIISGAVQDRKFEMGLELFLEMMGYGFQPNEFTFASVLKACANLEAVEFGLSTHCLSLKLGIDMNLFVGSLLIHMYAKCRDVGSAENVFRFLNDRDLPCWNALVGGYAMHGYSFEVLEMLSLMHRQGFVLDEFTFISALKGCSVSGDLNFGQQIHGFIIRNTVEFSSSVMNSLMNMYFKTGRSDCALKIFNRMQIKDVISWNTALSGFAQDENVSEAVDVFSKMFLIGVKPNRVTLSILFRLCGAVGDLFLGLQFCCLAYRLGFLADALVCNSVIYMFSRCGDIRSAHSVFKNLHTRDVIAWNEMIVGYNLNGCDTEALWLFCDLLGFGIVVDDITWSSILGHFGFVDLGRKFFNSISSDYRMEPSPNNYACLIDLLARNGFLEEAREVIEDMPFEPWTAVWRSLLSGCRINGNRELGQWAAEQLLHLMPDNDAAYMLLSEMYAEEGSWDDFAMVRRRMKERGVQKESGYRVEVYIVVVRWRLFKVVVTVVAAVLTDDDVRNQRSFLLVGNPALSVCTVDMPPRDAKLEDFAGTGT
ncbi:hypothetical protein ACLOJK_017099 [Asimina triloba]